MRKCLALFLALAILFCFPSCQSSNSQSENSSQAESESSVEVPEEKTAVGCYRYDGEHDYYNYVFLDLACEDGQSFLMFSFSLKEDDFMQDSGLFVGEGTKEDPSFHFEDYMLTVDVEVADEDTLKVEHKEADVSSPLSGTYVRIPEEERAERLYPPVPVPTPLAVTYDDNCDVKMDKALAKAARESLGLPDSARLTKAYLSSVTNILAMEEPVRSFEGIDAMTSLETFSATTVLTDDFSPVNGLKHLWMLDAPYSYLTSIPDLSGCTSLRELHLPGARIEDVTNIESCPSLTYIDLNCNEIRSIKPFTALRSLTALNLYGNPILDYEEVEKDDVLCRALEDSATYTVKDSIRTIEAARKILNNICTDSMTDTEKLAAIHRYLIDTTEYEEGSYSETAYGARVLLTHAGVCGNYAEAFSLLANLAGVRTWLVTSDNHAWNIAYIDGIPYHFDSLWDEGHMAWTHFGRSTAYIFTESDHAHDLLRYPYCEKDLMNQFESEILRYRSEKN